ncbi:MAG: hypothetical protein U0T78_09525 [Cloacibacterium normanense]
MQAEIDSACEASFLYDFNVQFMTELYSGTTIEWESGTEQNTNH